MVGRCDPHAVKSFLLRQQLTKIRVALGFAELLLELEPIGPRVAVGIRESVAHQVVAKGQVNVADCADVLGLGEDERVLASHAAKSDDGDVYSVARRALPAPEYAARKNERRTDGGHRAERGFAGIGNELAA